MTVFFASFACRLLVQSSRETLFERMILELEDIFAEWEEVDAESKMVF